MENLPSSFGSFITNLSSSAPVSSGQPRGLYNFILEIRNSQTKEEERSRVDKVK